MNFRFASGTYCTLVSLFLGSSTFLAAQPGGRGAATKLELGYTHSAAADAEFAGRTSGDVSVDGFSIEIKGSRALRPHVFLSFGAGYQQFSVDAPSGVPLSDTLQALKAELGATFLLDKEWSLTVAGSPGLYSAGSSLDGDGFNMPTLVLATWRASETFSLSAGLRYDAFSDTEVLPFLGFRWQATPEVTVSLGAPRTEVVYAYNEETELFAGASFQGGSFHIDEPSVVPPAGYPSLRDTQVDYREIRLGGGVRWTMSPAVSLELEAGWMVDRRFDYYERSLEVKTDGAAYGRLGLTARF